jgi:2-oxoglutarate ferredoxin oxidoreductase subunit gamma
MYQDVIMSGYGGQGILMIGNLLSIAAMREGWNVTYYPVYGVEMRGGAASCTVVISDMEIGSPIVGNPGSVIAMDQSSLEKHEGLVKEGGTLIVNSSLCRLNTVTRKDLVLIPLPANDMAEKAGSQQLASMVAFGAYLRSVSQVGLEGVIESLPSVISNRYKEFIPLNRDAILEGANIVNS